MRRSRWCTSTPVMTFLPSAVGVITAMPVVLASGSIPGVASAMTQSSADFSRSIMANQPCFQVLTALACG